MVRLEEEDEDLWLHDPEVEQEAREEELLPPLQLPLHPTNLPDPLPPVGACLQLHLPHWMALFPSSPWIMSVGRFGFRILFETPPPPLPGLPNGFKSQKIHSR